MPTYRLAPDPAQVMLWEIIQAHYPDLVAAGIRIKLLSAHAPRNQITGEPKGPALKLHGYAALGIAKIIPHEKRVAGEDDAQITIDGDRWDDLTEPEQRALLDHELNHFIVCRTQPKRMKGQAPVDYGAGDIILDDCHRPKLKTRLHDIEIGGFKVIAERHGDNAAEVKNIKQLCDDRGQLLFPWCAELAMT